MSLLIINRLIRRIVVFCKQEKDPDPEQCSIISIDALIHSVIHLFLTSNQIVLKSSQIQKCKDWNLRYIYRLKIWWIRWNSQQVGSRNTDRADCGSSGSGAPMYTSQNQQNSAPIHRVNVYTYIYKDWYLSQKLSFTVRSSRLCVNHHLRDLRLNVLWFTPVRLGGRLNRWRRFEQIRIHHFTGKTLRCGETSRIHSSI